MVYLSSKDEVRKYQDQYKYFYIGLLLFFLLIFTRLWYLQIFKGESFKNYADQNRVWKDIEEAPRGLILDRNGKLLVDNKLSFDVVVRPQYLKKTDENLIQISKLLNYSVENIKLVLAKAKNLPPFYPVIILEDVDRDVVASVESKKYFIPGLDIATSNKRTYLLNEKLAHLIGYIGESNREEINNLNKKYEKQNQKLRLGSYIGKFGVEKIWDEYLRGNDGVKYVIVDANGRMKDNKDSLKIFGDLENIASVPGQNITLTIDEDMQNKAAETFKDKKGAVVAISLKSGEILTMLSTPSFDPTVMSKGISSIEMKALNESPFRPFYNKIIQDHYSPGSTYKTLVAVAALEEGLIDEDFNVNCKGNMRFGTRLYHCHLKRGHGTVSLHQSLVKSCDIFYYRLGMKLGVDLIYKYAHMFGLGQLTGIDLLGEIPGLAPNSEWKLNRFKEVWMPGEDLPIAIGQGYNLVTPLQLANLYGGIATGKIYKPKIVKSLNNFDGTISKEFKDEILYEPKISEKTRKLVVDALYGVVNEVGGTAWWYRDKDLDIAGKTGTVQLYRISADKIYEKCEEMEETKRHHGWFVGFAPAKNPEIVVAVIAEHACHGSSAAAPVVRDVIRAYYNKYGFGKE